MTITEQIRQKLFSLQDEKYKQFQCSLMPTVSPEKVIGVRTPQLRAFAKTMGREENIQEFLLDLPHLYYEENNLHGFIIEQIDDVGNCIKELDRFLPYVDNWATCDSVRPKCLKKDTKLLLDHIEQWLRSDYVYTVRFGIQMLMVHYLDENFAPSFLAHVALIQSDEYYINMMIAWYFATALAKQYESAVVYLENHCLQDWVHNKTIQKAIESFRITPEQKAYLRSLKRKS